MAKHNVGAGDLHFLVVSTMEFPNLAEPDSNKVGALATAAVGSTVGFRAFYVRENHVDCYNGEDGEEIDRIVQSRAH